MRRPQRLGGVQTASLQVYPYALSAQVWPGPPGAPVSVRLSPTTGTFHAAGCVSSRAGSFDAVGDSNPVPQRVTCPRPRGNVTARAGCPRPRHLSVGHPWHPEPLVRQLHRRRRPTTSSGPPTGARSGQVGEGMGTPWDAQVRQTLVTIPHRSGMSSPLSQQPGTLGEDRQVHPVAGTDPLLRTAQVGLDG